MSPGPWSPPWTRRVSRANRSIWLPNRNSPPATISWPLRDRAGVEFQKIPTRLWKFYLADVTKWLVKQAIRHPDRRRPSYRDWESRTQRAHYDCSKARRVLNWVPTDEQAEIIRYGIDEPARKFLV